MEIISEIKKIKNSLAGDLIIMAHYYQNDEIVACADLVGDSYKLALEASKTQARHIILCGVLFMAESARILARSDQKVYIPSKDAGCPLADMIDVNTFKKHYAFLQSVFKRNIIPILYVNSPADVKAAIGKAGGTSCTSSNAALIADYYLKQGEKIFFLPDQNLGINIAISLGLSASVLYRYDSKTDNPALSPSHQFIVWDGFCHVHTNFTLFDIQKAKNRYPHCKIFVHPECTPEVVQSADFSGSTSQILTEVEKAEAGDVIFIGTEYHFVNRLMRLRNDINVYPLKKSICGNMAKITLQKLYETVVAIAQGESAHEINLSTAVCNQARHSLKAMIEITEKRNTRNG
jgi:quinolinate synthase